MPNRKTFAFLLQRVWGPSLALSLNQKTLVLGSEGLEALICFGVPSISDTELVFISIRTLNPQPSTLNPQP